MAPIKNATVQTCQSYENQSLPCLEFEYDLSFWRSTIVNEFDLVCDRAWLSSMTKSTYQIGYGISSIGIGIISDRYGRLFALKTSVFLEIVSSLSQALSVNIYHFLVSRLFLGIAAYGRFLTSLLLCE